MDAYATLTELQDRLDWALDADELRIAVGALEDASDLARGYGRDWDTASVPRLVRTLVLKAVTRYLRNPDGYTISRAGDETLGWSDAAGENAGTVYFTEAEQKLLKGLAGNGPGLVSVPVLAWGPQRRYPVGMLPPAGTVPTGEGQKPFPYYPTEEGPW